MNINPNNPFSKKATIDEGDVSKGQLGSIQRETSERDNSPLRPYTEGKLEAGQHRFKYVQKATDSGSELGQKRREGMEVVAEYAVSRIKNGAEFHDAFHERFNGLQSKVFSSRYVEDKKEGGH